MKISDFFGVVERSTSACPELSKEPRLCERPPALQRRGRHAHDVGGLLDAQASEEPEFDDADVFGVGDCEPRQGLVEGFDVDGAAHFLEHALVQRDAMPLALTFLRSPRTCAFDENLPHRVCRDTQEVGPILWRELPGAHQAQPGFVDQSRGLQRLSRALASDLVPSDPSQLVVHKRHQCRQRALVAGTSRLNQLRDLVAIASGGAPTALV